LQVACIETIDGQPTLVIRGKARAALAAEYRANQMRPPESFADSPFDLYHICYASARFWKGEKVYDFTELDEIVAGLREQQPDAYFWFRVSVDAPPWWEEQHPEQLCRFAPHLNSAALYQYDRLYKRSYTTHDYPASQKEAEKQSIASEVWRQDASEAMRAFVRHIEDGPCAEYCLGYHVCAFWGTEWFTYGLFENRLSDYSRPMVEHFRRWLRKKYGEDQALQAAWGQAEVTLDSAQIPDQHERLTANHFNFRDPSQSRHILDFLHCFAQAYADGVKHFAGVAQQETQGQKISGAFYGYLAYGGMFPFTLQNSGHRALRRVLDCNEVDYLASPYGYNDRYVGGDCLPMTVIDSLRRHGKLYWLEDDSRLHLSPPEVGDFGRVFTPGDSEGILKRNLASALIRQVGIWLTDWTRWYQDPNLTDICRRMREVFEEELANRAESVAEIAVVLDDHSPFYERLGDDINRYTITKQLSREMGRVGTPYEMYMLEDLEGLPDSIKCLFFLNCWHLDEGQRELVQQAVRQSGRTAIWVYASGYVADTLAVENIAEVTGIKVTEAPVESDIHVRVTDFDHPITRELPPGLRYGIDRRIGPIFYGTDEEAQVLGLVEYEHFAQRPGLLVKEFKQWRSVYSAAPYLPASLLRGIARSAGIHIYCSSNDVLYANSRFLAIHADYTGQKSIHLPCAHRVTDVFAQEVLAEETVTLSLDMQRGETRLLQLD